jgi:hypothetical protein
MNKDYLAMFAMQPLFVVDFIPDVAFLMSRHRRKLSETRSMISKVQLLIMHVFNHLQHTFFQKTQIKIIKSNV